MTREEEVRRAAKAELLLKDAIHVEAWEAVRDRLIRLMETAQTDEATLKAKMALGLLADVRKHWERVIQDGKLAAEEIRLEKERKVSPLRNWLDNIA